MKSIFSALKNPVIIKIAAFAGALILISAGVWYVLKTKERVFIEDSLVTAPITSLSSPITGNIKSILVSNGDPVKKGDALAVIGSETIRAFTDGIIVEANKQIGSLVTPQIPVIKMLNTSEMRIDGTLDENKGLNKIKVGQIVSFTIDALPGEIFWGYVDEISATAKQTQATFSISSERHTQQFEVFARFDARAYSRIKNGMSAKMTVYTYMP